MSFRQYGFKATYIVLCHNMNTKVKCHEKDNTVCTEFCQDVKTNGDTLF